MTKDQIEHKRRVRGALAAANGGRRLKPGEPAFHVVLATDYNGNGCLLRWENAVPSSDCYPKQKVLARYACFPADQRHDGGPLLPPVVELPLEHAQSLLEACRGGKVTHEAVMALSAAVQAVS